MAGKGVVGLINKAKRKVKQTFTTQGQFTKMRTERIKKGKAEGKRVPKTEIYNMADTAAANASKNRKIAAGAALIGTTGVVAANRMRKNKEQKRK